MDHQAVAEDRDVGALPERPRLLQRNQVLAFRHRLLEHSVQALVLEEEHGVRVTDGRKQQALGLVWARGDHDLQPRRRKPRLDGLRVIERAVRVAAHRRSHHEGHGPVAVAAVPVLRDLVGDRVERHVREVGELHLRDRSLARDGKAQRHTRDR